MGEGKYNMQMIIASVLISIVLSVVISYSIISREVGPPGIEGAQGLQGEQGIQGIQGEQGVQGESFAFEGEWVLTTGWYWEYTELDEWTYTFTTEADFIMIQPAYIAEGEGFMSCYIYEGSSIEPDPLIYWSTYNSTREFDCIMLIGKGTYTIKLSTSYIEDIWLDLYEFLSY